MTAGHAVVGTDRVSYKEKVHMVNHNLSGQIIEATGLKENLSETTFLCVSVSLALYIKDRII